MSIPILVLGVFAVLLAVGLCFAFIKFITARRQFKNLYNKYKDIIDIEWALKRKEQDLGSLQMKYDSLDSSYERKNADLNENYKQKRSVYDKLLAEVELLEESLDFKSYGLYEPHYDFDTSEDYKEELSNIRQEQKLLVRDKSAAICHTVWTVEGSKQKGKKMTNRYIKVMLRAFNNECDAAVLKVKWNNIDKMEARITKAFEAINKLGEPQQVEITPEYLELKLSELHLAHEYQEKRHEEKEEQRRIREQMREEEKAQREIEKAKEEAEKEEEKYEDALKKAREEVAKAEGRALSKLNEKITALEQQLQEAHEQKERAISRAQLTKSGHVYVISNIGSFGEDVYKIGMTRRLEPLDRVKELGDASVPFRFDVHAIIYSDNAPELENILHKTFNDRRMNMVNNRKEFFRAQLEEIEKVVHENHGEIEFTKISEAKEFRETLAILGKKDKEPKLTGREDEFPDSLF